METTRKLLGPPNGPKFIIHLVWAPKSWCFYYDQEGKCTERHIGPLEWREVVIFLRKNGTCCPQEGRGKGSDIIQPKKGKV